MNRRVLVVAAHPDDEILGCGGAIARLIKERYEAYTLILGEGVTSRDEKRDTQKRKREIRQLKQQAEKANKIIGVKKIFLYDFPDNRFDTIPLLDIVKVIEKIKEEVKPDKIFTHYENDLNVDHEITYKAVITAARPLPDETVKEIYSFESLSSIEYNYPLSFLPNVFFDIGGTMEIKLKAIKEYISELKEFPHPRSLEGIRLNAKMWGMKVGLGYAEAFKLVRAIK